uniref:Uncharacterized protein n=1 Tax=Kalanchoe fedtschenkoi TaxID=63787 RepID=A0A7N0T6X9_KALFE
MEGRMESELRRMKKELTAATAAEEKSRKAMDDLASALREVAAEASEANEKLKCVQAELKAVKLKLKSTEEQLAKATAECNQHKNAAERLRVEADETLAAWGEKESGLVGCMKRVEEERSMAQAENAALQEEMRKLRDILKQAMNEAIGAKEDASLAKAENSALRDQLSEKDTALGFASRELDSLRLSESAARNSLIEMKLASREAHDIFNEKQRAETTAPDPDPNQEGRKAGRAFSFDMRCTGKNKRFEDLVDQKAIRGGSHLGRGGTQESASSLRRNMSGNGRHLIDERQDSLRKKALSKRFGEVVGSKSSKSGLK